MNVGFVGGDLIEQRQILRRSHQPLLFKGYKCLRSRVDTSLSCLAAPSFEHQPGAVADSLEPVAQRLGVFDRGVIVLDFRLLRAILPAEVFWPNVATLIRIRAVS